MDRYRRRIAILSVGAQLGCPVGRRTEGEIEIARPVEIVFETTRSHTPTRFFFSRVLQPFVVKLLGKTVYQDMRRMEELFRNSNHHSTIAKRTAHVATPAQRVPARNTTRSLTHRPAVSAEYPWASCSHLTSTIPHLLADHFLVDLGRAGTTTLPLRLALRRGPVDLGEPGEHLRTLSGTTPWTPVRSVRALAARRFQFSTRAFVTPYDTFSDQQGTPAGTR